jgi:predicted RND superfamily exporter protein
MHAILPFLCLGIGIDDMFVIVQCLNNHKQGDPDGRTPVPDLIGAAMKHAGVSITVTSVTDVLAFGVGAVTGMPGLQSFCVCSALGLGSIYALQLGWFTAWLALDEERLRAARTSCVVPCVKQEGYMQSMMSCYRTLLSSLLYKVVIVLTSLCCLSCGLWGCTLIRHKFDPLLLLPSTSYLSSFIGVTDHYYNPYKAWSAGVYTGQLNHSHLDSLDSLTRQLSTLQHHHTYIQDYNCWWTFFKNYIQDRTNFSSWQDLANPEDFPLVLSDFLYSSYGARFKIDFQFSEELLCNYPAPTILATKFDIEYFPFDGPEEHVPAKDHIDHLLATSGLQDAFTFVKIYAAWETDRIIGHELWRNVGLAILCVFLITLILLANLQICLMVLGIVVLTLTDIVGFLHFWGITIDIISCINIVIAIGLCVDYSVHICHAYMVSTGSRIERALHSVESIGPAVFNGGFTTALALVLLGASTSHTFLTFFKVFLLTVVFGLFHGLLLLPVLLSVAGPGHQDSKQESDSDRDSTNSDNRAFQQRQESTKQDKLEPSWTISVLGLGKTGSWSPASEIV